MGRTGGLTMNTGEVIALIKAFGGSGGGSSGGGVLVVHMVNGTLDKTWREVYDAGFCVIAFTANKKDTFRCPFRWWR